MDCPQSLATAAVEVPVDRGLLIANDAAISASLPYIDAMDKSRSLDSHKVAVALAALAAFAVMSFTLAIVTVFEKSSHGVIAAPHIQAAGPSLG